MNKLQIVFLSFFLVAFIAILGWAGDIDSCEQTIMTMSQAQYDNIKAKLTSEKGRTPSDRDIAHYWQKHHTAE